MNRVEFLENNEALAPTHADALVAIKVLMPVWGGSYTHNFLEHCLPTLLAPGNVPALAAALPTEFVILTSADDESHIRSHAAFKRLAGICDAKIHLIDHLITDGNYSTTLTLAYTEEVRAAGAAMLNTCFFFLVSDYIVADGSLANALDRMRRGTSAVFVGNFQVARETALPWLKTKLASADGVLALSPRILMAWALRNLHPATIANTVNIPFSHNSHTNRLFWRVDDKTILGRFYLMHMLCLRPEVRDFIIGASCDYSFVPEMCPSGKIEWITDSDEYFATEMQPHDHEGAFIRLGPLKTRALAASLSEWTTAGHRENANHPLIFHAADVPGNIEKSIAQSKAFIAKVAAHRRYKAPLPHRGHPYWRGAMATFYDATGRRLTDNEWRLALGMPPSRLSERLYWRAKYLLWGRPPYVRPWHPAWPDMRVVFREIGAFFTDRRARLLLLSNEPTPMSIALADNGERVVRLRCTSFVRNFQRYTPSRRSFDLCLLELREEELWFVDGLLDRITQLMKPKGRIVLFVRNWRSTGPTSFGTVAFSHSERLVRAGLELEKSFFVPAGRLRWNAFVKLNTLRQLLRENPLIGFPIVFFNLAMLGLSTFSNIIVSRRAPGGGGPPRGIASSFVATFVVADDAPDGGDISQSRSAAEMLATPDTGYVPELEVQRTLGRASLGLVANRIWQEDPARLAVVLARYKFVATTISGAKNVGEVGCGDAFGTRIIAQQVPDVSAYDPNPHFIEDALSQNSKRWSLKALVHDITRAPLPRRHEVIVSLNMVEQVAPDDEDIYIANLLSSLEKGGMLIIGTSSGSAQRAGPLGRINCRSGKELHGLLAKYFARVLLVSMSGEVVQSGLHPTADYLLAICTGQK